MSFWYVLSAAMVLWVLGMLICLPKDIRHQRKLNQEMAQREKH